MSGLGLGNQPNLNVGQLNQEAPVKNEGQVGGDKGIISKGIGVLKKMWLHISGKASDTHSTQLKSLKDHVKNKFGEEGLAKLNERFDKKGWNSEKSSKLFSGSEIKSELSRVDNQLKYDKMVSDKATMLKGLPLSEQMQYPDIAKTLIGLASEKYCEEGLVAITVLNDMGANANDVSDNEITDFRDKFLDYSGKHCLNDNVLRGTKIDGLEHNNTSALKKKIDEWSIKPNGPEKTEEKQEILDILHGRLKDGVSNEVTEDVFMNKIGDSTLNRLYSLVGEEIVKHEIRMEALQRTGLA